MIREFVAEPSLRSPKGRSNLFFEIASSPCPPAAGEAPRNDSIWGFGNRFIRKAILAIFILSLMPPCLYAFEAIITVPAEDPKGVVLDLEKGDYVAQINGGAIALSYPISPNYEWLVGVCVGRSTQGGQDAPDIGTMYFQPTPAAYTQTEAERQALEAVKEKTPGTHLEFTLTQKTKVRFWVSDFDYTDNSGMVKLLIRSIQ